MIQHLTLPRDSGVRPARVIFSSVHEKAFHNVFDTTGGGQVSGEINSSLLRVVTLSFAWVYEPETCSCQNGAAFSGLKLGVEEYRERQAEAELRKVVRIVVMFRAAIVQCNAASLELPSFLDGGGIPRVITRRVALFRMEPRLW